MDLLDGFFLGEQRIDPSTGQVSCGDKSEHLTPHAVEVLLCLALRPRELVSRELILAEAWGDGQGSKEAVSRAVGEIRHALGDRANSPSFIQTVPKRGYRLLLHPEPGPAPDVAPPKPSESLVDTAMPLWRMLARHGVVQAGAAFLIVGWGLLQIADTTFDNLGLPPWTAPFTTFAVIGGFPLVLLLAWFFEVRDKRLVRDRGQQSGGLRNGLEGNLLPIVAAYAIAASGAGFYQYTVGFDPAGEADVRVGLDSPAAELIPIEPDSIAVLRLLNIDGSATTQLFSDGLGEDLLDRLATITGLRVSSRGDAWSLPDNASSDLVRRRLRVAYFLEGSVRVIGDQLRVVVQLINSRTGFHIASRSFDRQLPDFMSVQSEITDLVVANLRPDLPENQQLFALQPFAAADLDAYVLFRRGKRALNQEPTLDNITQAIDLFRQALSHDPVYAAAHAGLCDAFIRRYQLSAEEQYIKIAEQACASALSQSSHAYLTYDALGRLYRLTGRVAEAELAYLAALRANARDVSAMQGLAAVYSRQQRFEEARRMLVRAVELQPGNWKSINFLGNMLFGRGEFSAAAAEYRKVIFLNPGNWTALGNLGSALMMAGDFGGAREAFELSLEIKLDERIYSNLGIISYYLGDFAQSVDIHRQVVELSPKSNAAWLNLADALNFSGDTVQAQEAFRRSARLSQNLLAVDSSKPEALYLLSWAQEMTGAQGDADAAIQRALELAPGDLYAHYYDALIKTHRGDFAAATTAVKASIELGYPLHMLVAEPYLAKLQAKPEFTRLVAPGQKNK